MFVYDACKVGIQRKAVPDLVNSVESGLLAKQISMMGNLEQKILIVEGQVRFTTSDKLIVGRRDTAWTKRQFQGVLWSARAKGLWVEHTDSIPDTIQCLASLEAWFRKGNHTSLDRRPGPTNMWGTSPDHRDFGIWTLQSIPAIGPALAERIWDHFGLPIGWRITEGDLCEIEGIGPKKAKQIIQAFGQLVE